MSKFAEVLLPLAVKGTFTYAVPDGLTSSVGCGFRVSVPLGKSKIITGIVVELHDRQPAFRCRDIIAVVDSQPVVLPQQWRLWRWIADYYMATEGEVLNVALPAGLKNEENYRPRYETCVTLTDDYRSEEALHRALDSLHRSAQQQKAFITFLSLSHWDTLEGDTCRQEPADVTRDELLNASLCRPAAVKALVDKGILGLYQREVGRIGGYAGEQVPLKPLNRWQEDAYNSILMQLYKKNVVLLHGVTSSGKTEIYIHLIQKTLQEKKQVLYLLPEIALTVQITHRLQRVFGDELGIYHSKYSDEERVEIWQKQLSTQPYGVILGARSAVFLPFQNLGRCEDPAWNGHPLDGELLQCRDGQVWTDYTDPPLPGPVPAGDRGGGCGRPAAPQDDDGTFLSPTAGCHTGFAGQQRTGNPLPEPQGLCSDDRVQDVWMGAQV